MRFFLAAAICVLFIGGLSFYMNQRAVAMQDASPATVSQAVKVRDQFVLEITPTFKVEPDPFAIQLDDADLPPALLVRLGKKDIFRETEKMEAGIPLRIDPLEGLVVGENELYIEANPPVDKAYQSQALRIRLINRGLSGNGQAEADRTFWSEPGGKVAGVFRFTIHPPEKKAKKENGHDDH